MELGICYLYNPFICGETDPYISDKYIIYETFSYHKIDTPRTIRRKLRFVNDFNHYLLLNGDNDRIHINIIKRFNLVDGDGNVVSCAIYYTYLLRIIQKKWKKIIQYRKMYLQTQFIHHLRKREVTPYYKRYSIDSGLHGLFYRPINPSNFILG